MVGIVVLVTGVVSVGAQTPAPGVDQPAAGMMADVQKVLDAMYASDQRLGELIGRIDSARGDDARIDAIAAALKEMAAQRAQAREQVAALTTRMTGRMAEHMAAMQAKHGAAGMSCSMMKGAATPAAEPDHSQHHPTP
jgi:hypothetical protein